MPIQIEKLNLIAQNNLGYKSYDEAILDLYFVKGWALPPIANRFGVSTMTIHNRLTKYHKRDLRPKGGKRKSCHAGLVPVEAAIPVKSLRAKIDCENYKPVAPQRGGNSIWYDGVRP